MFSALHLLSAPNTTEIVNEGMFCFNLTVTGSGGGAGCAPPKKKEISLPIQQQKILTNDCTYSAQGLQGFNQIISKGLPRAFNILFKA